MALNNKISIFIAEDEIPILNNIVSKVQQCSADFEVVGTAANGEDAFCNICRLRPQILLTDIRMPIMDGLELCRKVHEFNPHIHMIIISGYNEFQYAQEALKIGVTDYLLKPVKQEDLDQLLFTLQPKIKFQRSVQERNILSSALFNPENHGLLPSNFPNYSFITYTVCLGNLITHPVQNSPRNKELDDAEWEHIIKSTIPAEDNWWLIDETATNQKFLLIATDNPFAIQIDHLGKQLLVKFSKVYAPVTIAAAPALITYHELKETSHALREQIFYSVILGHTQFLSGHHSISNNTFPASLPESALKGFSLFCKTENFHAFFEQLEQLLDEWEKLSFPQYLAEKQMFQLLYAVKDIFGISEQDGRTYDLKLYDFFVSAMSYKQLYKLLKLQFEDMFQLYSQKRFDTVSIIKELQNYFLEHYADSISIDKLAQKYNLNMNHLIRSFKKVVGESPMRYLLKVRMDKAIFLLRTKPELSIKEISLLVGYDDQHYFNRIFKKYTSKTPTDYRMT